MPSTPKLSDIWEYTPTEVVGHDSKSDTGKSLRFWVKTNKIDEFYQSYSGMSMISQTMNP